MSMFWLFSYWCPESLLYCIIDLINGINCLIPLPFFGVESVRHRANSPWRRMLGVYSPAIHPERRAFLGSFLMSHISNQAVSFVVDVYIIDLVCTGPSLLWCPNSGQLPRRQSPALMFRALYKVVEPQIKFNIFFFDAHDSSVHSKPPWGRPALGAITQEMMTSWFRLLNSIITITIFRCFSFLKI